MSDASTRTAAKSPRGTDEMTKADWRVVVHEGFSALFDLVGDWAYLYAIYHRDYDGDGETNTWLVDVNFNYNTMVHVVLAFCILSTLLSAWTILTSLGRRCNKNSLCCNCTVPRLAMAGIILEDLPQFVLTTYIDFTFSGGWTPAGVMNICSSLTSLVNRSTTRYDQIENENEEEVKLDTVYEQMT